MSAAKNWIFTLNNYTVEQVAFLKEKANVEFIYWGHEIAPTTGTPHLQGFVRFPKKKKLVTIKNEWNLNGISLRLMDGTKEENIAYCSKKGKNLDVFFRGEWKTDQGKRTDLDKARNMAQNNGMRAVSAVCNAQQIRVAEKFLTYNEECRDFKPHVVWIWGPPGVGKSRRAREITGFDDVYTKNDGTKWWDGYDGHDYVIIDDFRGSWWTLTEMLSLLDRYEKRIEFKGGWRQMLATTMVITSLYPPETVYSSISEEPKEQLVRRISQVIHLVPEVPEVGGNTIPQLLRPENDPSEDNIA